MRILCIGDVVGAPGVAILRRRLSSIKKQYEVDLCVVNGENADKTGTGIHLTTAQELLAVGADVLTTGNHALRRAGPDLYEKKPDILCPANAYWAQPGWGLYLHDMGRRQVAVINLMGAAYLPPVANPFHTLDALLAQAGTPFVVVDFHGESTAEKKSLAFHADGRISALFGTHTHVQTTDAQTLPGGTGYITDVGMTGPTLSVLGVAPQLAVEKQRTQGPVHFHVAEGPCAVEGVLFQLDDATGLCTSAQALRWADPR